MSVAILGGMDRLKCYYIKQGRDLGFSSVKVFSRKFPNMLKRLKGFSGIVICTGNVAQANGIPIARTRSSSVSALKNCLKQMSN